MSIKSYSRVLQLLPNATLILTTSGKIVSANAFATKLFKGIDLKALTIFELIDSSSHEVTKDYLKSCSRSTSECLGAIYPLEKFSLPTQSVHGALLEPKSENSDALVMFRLENKNKSLLKFSVLQEQIDRLNNEIEKRIITEKRLKRQSERLEVTLTSIVDAVIIIDTSSNVVFSNPTAEELTGSKLAFAKGKPIRQMVSVLNESHQNIIHNIVEQTINSKKVVDRKEVVIHNPNTDTSIDIIMTAAPIQVENKIEGAIIVFHDVTEKMKLERQLRNRARRLELVNERKNQFLTMLAHELRSPLTPISNAIQLMKLQPEKHSAFVQSQEVMERQINHIKRLLDDMLDVARITSGKIKIIKEKIDLAALIKSVCEDYKEQFSKNEIGFESHLPSTKVFIDADFDRITQVLHNLLNNALKFTPKDGCISLLTEVNQNTVEITLKDTGIGIEKNALIDIFEPFTQADQPLDRSSGGLGLGLSLVKGLVELHDGSVTINSKGKHQGTEFKITLPLAECLTNSDTPKVIESDSLYHRILLIEDDVDVANTMAQLLEMLGHEVHCAHTGPEGLNKAFEIDPSFIICDIGLPELDGFAVAKSLRDTGKTAKTPLVALSGYGEMSFVNRAKEAGFDLHLTKPASLADIKAALTITH